MKVLLINGSPNEHGCTYTALSEVAQTLHGHGIKTELLYLGKKPVALMILGDKSLYATNTRFSLL